VADEEVGCDAVKSSFGELMTCGVRSSKSAVTSRLRLSVLLDFTSTGRSVVFPSSVTPSVVKLAIFVDKDEAGERDFASVAVTCVVEYVTSSLSDLETPSVEYSVALSVA